MFGGLADVVLEYVRAYGYVAFFVFVVLETSWVLHFAPSEVVIPFAGAYLVSSPPEFALFVCLGTAGAVVGSLLAYYAFGVNGDRVLRRWGHLLHVPESEVKRSQRWIRRWGDGLLFWGRLVPVVRTPISIPAGFARVDLRRFVAFSAGGWMVYMAVLTALVYDGGSGPSPFETMLAFATATVAARPLVVGAAGLAVAGATAWYVSTLFDRTPDLT